jgi:hypothetical protein
MARMARVAVLWAVVLSVTTHATAQTSSTGDALMAYKALHAFVLDGGSAKVTGLLLKRDRAEMTFTGTFYFPKTVMGRTTGAVFVGQGRFHADPPENLFEKENLKRILAADTVDSDFKTAVLRFTDDSDALIGTARDPAMAAPGDAQELAEPSRIRSSRKQEPTSPAASSCRCASARIPECSSRSSMEDAGAASAS